MNNRYLKLLIKSGIKALTGAAALAAAAVILKSDDKKEPQNSEKEVPKHEKAPQAAPEVVTVPKKPSENAAYYAAKAAQAEKAAPQADISKQPENVHTEDPEKTENSSPQTDWDKWEIIYRRFTNRPPVKNQYIYVPDYLLQIKPVEIPKISLTEKEAEEFGYSFRKKSKRIRITNCHGSEKSIIIPEYIGGMLVNEIGANAFTNSRAERVAIPDNIKKLGDSAFAESGVQFVIFGKGLREIPKTCFYNCKNLKIAAIPPLTDKLGEKAFFGCVSLKYIELPWELHYIGEECFCGSGLEGFAARFQGNFYPDGSAFANTPLHKNYGLVLLRKYDPKNRFDEMNVLLVGQDANIIFTEPRVHLGKNSVCAPCILDFTECGNFNTSGAFKYKPEYIYDNYVLSNMWVDLPEGYCGLFPSFVETCGDRSSWCENLNKFRRSETNELRVKSDLCSYLLSELNIDYRKDLTLVSNNDRALKIENYAVGSSWLRKIRFAGEFIPGEDCRIFDPICFSLREVRWQGFAETTNGRQTAEYIQFLPAYAVRPDVHRELLKAFCGDGHGGFFDPKIIENVFDNGIIRSRSKTRMELSHREKILIAIDVLRSSPELYPEGTERYSQFLRRHINYAKDMCKRLPREVSGYLEFLNKFALPESSAFPDEYYPKISEIYVPEKYEPEKAEVPEIELTEKQAVEEGWSFQKKSKSVRITNYHGKQRDVIVPHKIGGLRVNELSAKAFMNTKVGRVQIPDGVVKAGKELFYRSTVRRVIFGSGLDVIPEYAFSGCDKLEHIILPDTLWGIKKEAFYGCKSLEYIKFPDSLVLVGRLAFCGSGLKGFSMRNPTRLDNGNAFNGTPLVENYKLIATKNDGNFLDILKVGKNAKVKLPKVYATFKRNSLCGNCSLDLSECTGLDLQRAIPKIQFSKLEIIVRRGQEGYYFGEYSDVKYTDGSPYPELLKPLEQNGDELLVEFAGGAFRHQFIPSGYVHFGVKSLKITTKLFLTLYQYAFDDPKLERLEIDYYFSVRGEIFHPFNCTSLREVRWKGKNNNGNFVQYIPPAALISGSIHHELLRAFRDTNDWGFFESSVIDKIFSDKCLEYQYNFTSANPRYKIRQRQLILIAIDVLRGTPGQFANGVEMYSKYLSRHLKYARKVCEKIKPEFPEYMEFLDSFK